MRWVPLGVKIFFSTLLIVFSAAFMAIFMFIPFYYGHSFLDLSRFKGATTLATMFILLYSFIVASIAFASHNGYKMVKQRFRVKSAKSNRDLLSLLLACLLALSVIYDAHAYVSLGSNVSEDNRFLGTIGHWDVKGFEWSEPDNAYPSGFSYGYENGVITVWVGDWEHDYYQGVTVGAVRQGSVWDSATAPWYDQTSYQPSPLHFAGTSSIVLNARVRIDTQHRTGLGWTNWLFNPWFKVQSTYKGVTKERKMVWDIVWGWNCFAGVPNTQDFIDEDEILHLVFFLPEMAQNNEWKTYTIDLLTMAEEAQNRVMQGTGQPVKEVWNFDVDSIYLWSIDVCVEGFDYDTQFSVQYLRVNYTVQGSAESITFASSWGDEG